MLYTPPSGSTDPNASYVGKDVAAGKQGSKIAPGAVENPQREIMSVIAAGKALGLDDGSNGDLAQMLKVARSGLLGRYVATGTPDAIAIAPQPVYVKLVEGMRFRFKIPGANVTNATTSPTFAVNGIAPVALKTRSGRDPAVGDLVAGNVVEAEIWADGTARIQSTLASDGAAVAQSAGSPFNSRPLAITGRAALQGNQPGQPATAFSGPTYTKQLAGSRVVVQGKFQTRSTFAPGNGNGAQYFIFNVGSGFVRLALNNGYPGSSANNTLYGVIYGLPVGALAVSGAMQREDSLQWYTTFLPTSADESGYPPVNLADFTIHEEV